MSADADPCEETEWCPDRYCGLGYGHDGPHTGDVLRANLREHVASLGPLRVTAGDLEAVEDALVDAALTLGFRWESYRDWPLYRAYAALLGGAS